MAVAQLKSLRTSALARMIALVRATRESIDLGGRSITEGISVASLSLDRPVVSRTRTGIAAWAWTAGTTAAYSIASLVLFHGVLGDLDDRAPLNGSGDVAQMAWFQSWTAWAIAHVHDPFVSYAINAPHGVNLMWNTAMPLAGAVMAPITLAFGPLTTVNVLFILGPITTALTARWWLGRHVESELARSVGGAVVGFGPFVAAHLGGHLNFTVLTLVPVLLRLSEDVCGVLHGAGFRRFCSGSRLPVRHCCRRKCCSSSSAAPS